MLDGPIMAMMIYILGRSIGRVKGVISPDQTTTHPSGPVLTPAAVPVHIWNRRSVVLYRIRGTRGR